MRLLRTRLLEARTRLRTPWEVLERDYLLSWLLAGVAEQPALRDNLVFKGGTALKKCYFGEYRFSEDLDFSGFEGTPVGDEMERLVGKVCATAVQLLDEFAPVEITCERYRERQPHPGGQEAFTIRVRLPWHSHLQTRVIIEITMDERILWPVEHRLVIHNYGEPLRAALQVYALEEIVAEKLRALLQQADMLEKRGWSRSRARDYYDLWRVFRTYGNRMDWVNFNPRLHEKCALRGVAFSGAEDFFNERILAHVEETWEQSLGVLVPDLPSFDTVAGELRQQIAAVHERHGGVGHSFALTAESSCVLRSHAPGSTLISCAGTN